MCGCNHFGGRGSVNGEIGAYYWNTNQAQTRQPTPPEALEGETVVFDEPGRCTGADIDSHCHHVTLFKASTGYVLACRHGGGTVRFPLRGYCRIVEALTPMDSDSRYWTMLSLWRMADGAAREAKDNTAANWKAAAVEKRIKVRKRQGRRYVEIAPRIVHVPAQA